MKKIISLLIYLTISSSNLAIGANKENSTLPVTPPASENVKTFYPSFADIVEPLIPAVVNIYTVKYNKKNDKIQKAPFPEGFPFDQFNDLFQQFDPFMMPFNFDEMYSNPKAVSLGSGFIIDASGLIVTNHHVVSNADEIHIKLLNNTELPAKLIGSDQRTDLALLKVESKNPLPFVKFGDSSKARVGDWVIAIGNPFGLGGTVTTGIVSSKGRDLDIDSGGIVDDFIQTDAAINSGNSGGPMFNMNGEIIGVNTAIFSPSGTNVGIGFAIPSNTTQTIIEELKQHGKVSRGKLDVVIQEVTTEIAEGLGLKEPGGALVVDVLPGGAGEKAGIKAGDVIIEFDGQKVKNSRKLQILVAETPINKEVKIIVLRNGKNETLTGKIIENIKDSKLLKISDKNMSDSPQNGFLKKNNVTFKNLTLELKQLFKIKDLEEGVVITDIVKDNINYEFKVGDIVLAVNQHPINNIEQLNKIYEASKQAKKKNIVLLVKRRTTNIFLALPIE